MAEGILGLGSDGSLDLSSELIEKLKTAESTSVIDPIELDIEEKEAEIEAFDSIATMTDELLELIEAFDLYTSDTNVFDSVSATSTGDSVSFDAIDTSSLETGTINVTINQLAQKDVYQSELISDIEVEMASGTLVVEIDGDSYSFTTDGKTYEELVTEMNTYEALDVSLEQVSDDEYRMVLKSNESGTANSLTISTDHADLGFTNTDNHVLESKNMEAEVDGISYELSNNQITLQSGLTITVLETGDSSITIEKDNSAIVESIEEVAAKYNELVDLVASLIYGDEDESAVISDGSTIRLVMTAIKEMMYESYGLDEDESVFNYGISFDSDGYMEIDTEVLTSAVTNNYDELKDLFVGYAEAEGLGTQLKTYLDSLDSFDGIFTTLEEKLDDDLTELEEDLESAQETLDDKYTAMATQFAAYTVIITQMENAFASLKSLLDSDE